MKLAQETFSHQQVNLSQKKKKCNRKLGLRLVTYNSITGLRNGATLSSPSRFARDCTKAMGII